MLCQRCNARDATNFVTTVIDGKATSSHFCDECMEITNPGAAANVAARLEAGCLYCGAKVGRSVCQECSKELHWFMELKGFAFPKEKPTVEQKDKLVTQWKEVMNYMSDWVAKGKPSKAE